MIPIVTRCIAAPHIRQPTTKYLSLPGHPAIRCPGICFHG
jgi:hypothetical protein